MVVLIFFLIGLIAGYIIGMCRPTKVHTAPEVIEEKSYDPYTPGISLPDFEAPLPLTTKKRISNAERNTIERDMKEWRKQIGR